jgi:hypothetical protein
MLADAVAIVHFMIVLFIVAGLPCVYLGAALHWAWVRSGRWRARCGHLGGGAAAATEARKRRRVIHGT